jgi:hypothetical protein
MAETSSWMRSRSSALALAALTAGAALSKATPAEAFCGFYVSGADTKLFNNATQVVLMREGTRTVLSMQNNYQGPPSDFAMVVPVPVILQKENVKTLPYELFAKIDQLDAPRLVEYWEQDPCAVSPSFRERKAGRGPMPPPAPMPANAKAGLGVTVEAQFTVGEYEIVILSAKDAAGLDTWLKLEKYKIPDGSEPLFRPYVQAGSKFFVARVDAKKVKFEDKDGKSMATLSPLRFHYDSPEFSLPVRLGLANSNGTQDLIVHVLARGQRYEVANYPNATIPTNFDVAESAREKFGTFYASLFDRTMEKNPKAVVTEYSWDAATCDPCPGPALTYADLATLGADAIGPANTTAPSPPSPPPPAPGPPGKPTMRGPRMGFVPTGFVITRLHARYSKESLGEDLVFRTASPIVGGREIRTSKAPDTKDEKSEPQLEHGAISSSYNNFQGRYAIRHPWGGPIACKEPKRGVWGGPPGGIAPTAGAGSSGSDPKAARDLAFVPRDGNLASFVRSTIPELGVKGEGLPVSAVSPLLANANANASGATDPTSVPKPSTSSAASPSGDGAQAKRGCLGCFVGPRPRTPGPLGLEGFGTLAGLVALLGRRRSRQSRSTDVLVRENLWKTANKKRDAAP